MEVRTHCRALRWVCVLAFATAQCHVVGCASPSYIKRRAFPFDATEVRLEDSIGRMRASDETRRFLWHLGLSEPRFVSAAFVCRVTKAASAPLGREGTFALAELSYIAARRSRSDDTSMELFLDATMYAWSYLFEESPQQVGGVYSARFREACDLYNSGLEGCLRLAQKQDQLFPGAVIRMPISGRVVPINLQIEGTGWNSADFERIEFVSDYAVRELDNHHAESGLGISLIAVRRSNARRDGTEQYFSEGLSFPVTALVHFDVAHDGHVSLYDTLATSHVSVNGQHVPLASDLTTPLAWYLNDRELRYLDTVGLVLPEILENETGMYMMQPYQPGKIPVLMVHGLWSSPTTWMEMINELISKPEIRERYQFWFYLYPSARPFWVVAADLRDDLAELRATVDPMRAEPALDNMVVIGHSMGGLIGRLLTADSSDEFRRGMLDSLDCPLGDRQWADSNFERVARFEADRSIRRVVTIATPHRGSSYANRFTRWLARTSISMPARATRQLMNLFEREKCDPGPSDNPLGLTSIDSLSPASPVLQALARAPRAAWVTYHNIIGCKPSLMNANTDGVVSYDSARVHDAASEVLVKAAHSKVHRHPLAIREVYRLLVEHLRAVGRPNSGFPATVGHVVDSGLVNTGQPAPDSESDAEPREPAGVTELELQPVYRP